MKHVSGVIFLLLLVPFGAFAQQATLSGLIRDGSSLETLIGATIQVQNPGNSSTRSNEYGFYSMTLSAGYYDLLVSYVGYKDTTLTIHLSKDQKLDLQLSPINTLQEVEVYANTRKNKLHNAIMGLDVLSTKDVENVPVIFGERDILKTIQLLPGVLAAGEGSAGFFVRGGSSDQNLIVLDEATVYNAAHLFGFFSTFNSDAIKDANLYKGGMPAQYGGRLSSILDVHMLDGNKKKFQAKGGIGLIASRLSLEGPLRKEKGSFMVSGRRTYADLFLKLSSDTAVSGSSLYFYDLNLKANYQLNDRNTLYLSGYFGKDALGYADSFNFDWGNATATLRWNHVYSPRLFSNLSLIYGNFDYNVAVFDDVTNFSIRSKIDNFNLKQGFQYFFDAKNTFRFGVDLLRQKIVPASLDATVESQINSIQLESRQGADLSAYVSHEWKALQQLQLEYGLRVNAFLALGPGTFSRYDESGKAVAAEIAGTNKVVNTYLNFEPRLSLNYRLNELSSLKLSFNRNVQNLHQLSNSTSSLPTDVWIMSSPNVKPQLAMQGALGYYRNLDENRYEFSTEVYYKDMRNQIDFKNGAEIQANPDLESDLLYGKGRAYGLELFLKKREGQFNGWISYTLSKSERKFDQLNKGNWYAARQDRRHDMNVVAMYEFNPRLSVSANFVVSSGNAVTFPSGKYTIDNHSVWYYSERNGYRMPTYHRLDLGVTLKSKPDDRFNSSWSFGVYNAYNRKNAYIINFRENKNDARKTEAYQIALFGIVPSVTWNFNF